ncbi:hypothetical protein TRVA0_039S01442 [Trichomonascus vanleenenianus]|uniref:HD domain-containing protein n=1 Tax=Trichomonascus vanleenenianus TaxID=2268995 RepID=UPI003EC97677
MAVIEKAEEYMTERMKAYDPSHDDRHVMRVYRMAVRIAESIPKADMMVVKLAALFHDLLDSKYDHNSHSAVRSEIVNFMSSNEISQPQTDMVLKIIDDMSYSKEKKMRANHQWTTWHESCVELHCVQDADRLDAMGAFGVFRAAGYSCAKGNPLYDSERTDTCHAHFADKLLKLKDSLKTEMGRQVGKKRHEIMQQVNDLILSEYALEDFP